MKVDTLFFPHGKVSLGTAKLSERCINWLIEPVPMKSCSYFNIIIMASLGSLFFSML